MVAFKKSQVAPHALVAFAVVCACLLLTFASTSGYTGVLPSKLSVSDAVTIALDVNANVKQSEYSYRTSLSRLRVAGLETTYGLTGEAATERTPDESSFYSQLFGSADYASLFGTKVSLDMSPFRSGDRSSYLRLSLRHPLTQGRGVLSEKGDIFAGARSETNIQSKELYLTRQAKALGIVDIYYRAVLAREDVKVQETAVAIAEEVADGARKRSEAGLVAGIEVTRAEIRVAQTKDQLNLRTQAAHGAVDRLTVTIGAGVGETPELVDTVPETAPETPELGDAVRTALANRLELAVYDIELSEQARTLAIAKDQFRSGLDVFADYTSSNAGNGAFSGSAFDEGSYTAGVEFRIPLDRRIIAEERDTAQRQVDVLRRLRTLRMEEIAEQVRQAYRDLEAAKTSLGILSENKKVADDNLRMARRMVEAGLVSNREILEAQEALTRVENGLLSAKTDLYLAGLNLKYAMGEDIITVVSK